MAPTGVGGVDHGADVVLDVLVAAGLERADLDDHVDLECALLERSLGLEDLRLGQVVAVREANDRAHLHVRAAHHLNGTSHVRGAHRHRGHVVLQGEPDVVLEELVVELRTQQRVVDRLGDLAIGQPLEDLRRVEAGPAGRASVPGS